MKTITRDDIVKIARLANLTITNGEIEKFQVQISSILSYVEKLGELDTSNVPPTNQVTGLTNITREDKTTDATLPQDDALKNAPQREGNLFKVPAIFEE